MRRHPLLATLAALAAGCAPTSDMITPLDIIGELINAPFAGPIAAVETFEIPFDLQRDEDEASTQELHRNPQALEGLDQHSQALVYRNLRYALEHGRLEIGVYWENPANRGGRAGGAATVVRESENDRGRTCREVLVETEMEGEQTDTRLSTFCRGEAGWQIVE